MTLEYRQNAFANYSFVDIRHGHVRQSDSDICTAYNPYFQTGCYRDCSMLHLESKCWIKYCRAYNSYVPSDDANYACKIAIKYAKNREYDHAIQIMKKLVLDYQRNAFYISKLAFFYQRINLFHMAGFLYRYAVSIEPGNQLYWLNLGIFRTNYLVNARLARKHLLMALSLRQDEPKAHAIFAKLMYKHFGHIQLAKYHYEKSNELAPYDNRTKFNYAMLLIECKEFDKAIFYLTQCIENNSPIYHGAYAPYWIKRSECYQHIYEYSLALNDVKSVLSIYPNNAYAIRQSKYLSAITARHQRRIHEFSQNRPNPHHQEVSRYIILCYKYI